MTDWDTCALCPRLCRTVCPVATGSAREAAVPTLMATALRAHEQGRLDRQHAVAAATLCTDCGACQSRCHIDRPLPQFLREFRGQHVTAPSVEPLQPILGEGLRVAIESDERPFAAVLARHLGEPVRRWSTGDRLGVALVEHPGWSRWASELRRHASSHPIVVVDGGVAEALTAASISFEWLHQVVRGLPVGDRSCRQDGERPLACCGAAGPLLTHHPEEAHRVGKHWLQRADEWKVGDARCRAHLRSCGGDATDPLDALMERVDV
jgi:Fe-S oxidoreductase